MRRFLMFAVVLAMTFGCASTPRTGKVISQPTVVDSGTETPVANEYVYYPLPVSKGDTLWSLAGRVYGNHFLWPLLWRMNSKILYDLPDYIKPGQILRWREVEEYQEVTAELEAKVWPCPRVTAKKRR